MTSRKRHMYFVILLFASAASVVSLVSNLLAPGGAQLNVLISLGVAVLFAGLAWIASLSRVPLPLLDRTLLVATTMSALGVLGYGLYFADDPVVAQAAVLGTLLWLPFLFLFSHITFEGRSVLPAALLIYLMVVVVTLPSLFMGQGLFGEGNAFLLLQAYMAFALLLIGLRFFSGLQERATVMEERAENMLMLAHTDALTGLANRRQAEDLLGRELVRAARYGRGFSVLMVDLDHFKLLNDGHGHQVGDEVLIDLSRRLQRMVRHSDTVARWGGEEFLILAPETSGEDAMKLAETVRRQIEEQPLADGHALTASIGVASYRDADSLRSLVARADAALYLAKRAGRNLIRREIPIPHDV